MVQRGTGLARIISKILGRHEPGCGNRERKYAIVYRSRPENGALVDNCHHRRTHDSFKTMEAVDMGIISINCSWNAQRIEILNTNFERRSTIKPNDIYISCIKKSLRINIRVLFDVLGVSSKRVLRFQWRTFSYTYVFVWFRDCEEWKKLFWEWPLYRTLLRLHKFSYNRECLFIADTYS